MPGRLRTCALRSASRSTSRSCRASAIRSASRLRRARLARIRRLDVGRAIEVGIEAHRDITQQRPTLRSNQDATRLEADQAIVDQHREHLFNEERVAFRRRAETILERPRQLGVADEVAGKTRKVRGPPSGEPVAAVVAVDERTAFEALEFIDVKYEELRAVFTPEEALAEDAPLLHERQFEAGALRGVPGQKVTLTILRATTKEDAWL